MVSNKSFVCETCGYSSNRKYNLELHKRSPNACDKRIKRLNNENSEQNATLMGQNPTLVGQNATLMGQNATLVGQNTTLRGQNATLQSNNEFNCSACNKNLSCFKSLNRHLKICKGVNSLQCPTCKKTFSNSGAKSRHMKNVKCELVLTEEQQRIKELEEKLEEKDKQLEEAKSRPTTVYNTTNNIWNNYFKPDIKYNDYDKLSTEHITNEQIHDMYIENRRYFPDVSEAVTRDLFRIEENRCIYVPEGQKGSYGIVYKDGKYIRKPITHIFATVCDTGARHMFECGAIPEKDYGDDNSVNFWNDMSRAIGLQKTDYDDLSQFDKDLITRQKYVGLDVQDEKTN